MASMGGQPADLGQQCAGVALLFRSGYGNYRLNGQWDGWEVRRRLSRSFSERPPQTPKRSSLLSA